MSFGSSLFNDPKTANDPALTKQFNEANTNPNTNASNSNSGFGGSLNFGNSNNTNSGFGGFGGFGSQSNTTNPSNPSNPPNPMNGSNSTSFGSSVGFGTPQMNNNSQNTTFSTQPVAQLDTTTSTNNNNSNSNNSNNNDQNGGNTIMGWGTMTFGQEPSNNSPQRPQQPQQPQQQQQQQQQPPIAQIQQVQQMMQQAQIAPNGQQSAQLRQQQQQQIMEQKENFPQSSGIDWSNQGKVSSNAEGTQYIHEKFATFETMGVLRNELLDGVKALGWEKPSKIQGTVLPLVLNPNSQYYNHDVIGQAHHGSGKTGAFVLNVLQNVDNSKRRLQAIILSHSRELATQTKSVVIQLGRYMQGLDTILAVPAIKETDRVPLPNQWTSQVCVGTPGVILYNVLHYDDKKRRPREKRGNVTINMPDFLRDFKMLVVDEADEFFKPSDMQPKNFNTGRMVRGRGRGGRGRGGNNGFGNQVTMYDQLLLIAKIIQQNTVNKKPQILLYSATLPPNIDDLVLKLGAKNPFSVKVEKEKLKLTNVKNIIVEVSDDRNKFEVLKEILIGYKLAQCIIFTNTVKRTKDLHYNLANNNDFKLNAALLVGQMDKKERDEHMEAFRLRETKCLIASNVIARGIDVPTVNLVVNYEIPYLYDNNRRRKVDSETFMHRVGRTGRYGTQGVCINFVEPSNVDDSKRLLEDVLKEYDLFQQAENINGVGFNQEQLEQEIKNKIGSWIEV